VPRLPDLPGPNAPGDSDDAEIEGRLCSGSGLGNPATSVPKLETGAVTRGPSIRRARRLLVGLTYGPKMIPAPKGPHKNQQPHRGAFRRFTSPR
jgi:hypothetical protein